MPGEYENVKRDVLEAYKAEQLELMENVCLMIEARNKQTMDELAEMANDPLVKLASKSRDLITGAFAYALSMGRASGFLDDEGEPSADMPKELQMARKVLFQQLTEFAEDYDEIMSEEDDDDDDDEDGEGDDE